MLIGASAVAGVAIIVLAVASALDVSPSPTASASASPSTGIVDASIDVPGSSLERQVPVEPDSNHVGDASPISYVNRPPSSGRHYTRTARYGVTAEPVAPGNWVHNLEHGAIVLLFRCDQDCLAIAQTIQATILPRIPESAFGSQKIVATPYQDMDAPFTVVAWGWILELETLDASEIVAFYRRHVDKGPESLP